MEVREELSEVVTLLPYESKTGLRLLDFMAGTISRYVFSLPKCVIKNGTNILDFCGDSNAELLFLTFQGSQLVTYNYMSIIFVLDIFIINIKYHTGLKRGPF